MKKLFLLLLAALVFTGSAEAATQTFGCLTLDVPEGWRVDKREGDFVIFWSPDDSTVLITGQARAEGVTLKAFAELWAREGNSDLPTAVGSWYRTSFVTQGDGDCYTFITGDEKSGSYLAVTMTAKSFTYPQFEAMYNSIRFTAQAPAAATVAAKPQQNQADKTTAAQNIQLQVVRFPPAAEIVCTDCKGTAKVTCTVCKGKGEYDSYFKAMDKNAPPIKCMTCKGSGMTMCYKCVEGVVSNPDLKQYRRSLIDLATQTGMRIFEVEPNQVYRYVGIEWCPFCGGAGWDYIPGGYMLCSKCDTLGMIFSDYDSFSDAELRRSIGIYVAKQMPQGGGSGSTYGGSSNSYNIYRRSTYDSGSTYSGGSTRLPCSYPGCNNPASPARTTCTSHNSSVTNPIRLQ